MPPNKAKGPRVSSEDQWASVEHGTTYAMAQRCYRFNPESGCCEACRKVWTKYVADWRASNLTGAARRAKEMDNARHRALWRLANLYPEVFQALVSEEAAKIKKRPRIRG